LFWNFSISCSLLCHLNMYNHKNRCLYWVLTLVLLLVLSHFFQLKYFS
jgi:hypothetical protein